jgi:hypothetical protein
MNNCIDHTHTHACLLRILYHSDAFTKEEKKQIKKLCRSRKPLSITFIEKYARYGESCSDYCPYFKTIQFYENEIKIL